LRQRAGSDDIEAELQSVRVDDSSLADLDHDTGDPAQTFAAAALRGDADYALTQCQFVHGSEPYQIQFDPRCHWKGGALDPAAPGQDVALDEPRAERVERVERVTGAEQVVAVDALSRQDEFVDRHAFAP